MMADVSKDNLVVVFQDFIDSARLIGECLIDVDTSLVEAVGDDDSALCEASSRLRSLTEALEVFHRRLDAAAAQVDRARSKANDAVDLMDGISLDDPVSVALADESLQAASILTAESASLLDGLNIH